MTETYDHTSGDKIAAVLVGRRIVEAEKGEFDFPGRDRWAASADGRLVLDDGTVLYLTGNDGGCACSAGCYPLDKVATVDNIITSARVEADPHDEDEAWGTGGRENGTYRIFVIADNIEINVAEFVGTDGNGYYGTGFEITVVRADPAGEQS